MTVQPNDSTHHHEELPADMIELTNLIGGLPAEYRGRIEPVLSRVVESTKRRRRILTLVQDALSQLRLDMKYLVFDLEATRRERDNFRQELEERSNPGEGS
ncbi:MAG: transcriptional regulator [Pirellulaceae bacterium]